MQQNLILEVISTPSDWDALWRYREDFYRCDLAVETPASYGEALSEEVLQEHFLGSKAKKHIYTLTHRAIDPMETLWLKAQGHIVGFCQYVIYHSEDGKCLLVDFYILPSHRGQSLGTAFVALLEQRVQANGARYLALNTGSTHARRFWERNGLRLQYFDDRQIPYFTKSYSHLQKK